MRVLIASTSGAGHVGPLLPFAAALRARGDEVLLTGPPSLAPTARTAGLPFHAGSEPDTVETAALRGRFAQAPPAEAAVLANRELFGRLCTAAMLPTIERLAARWRPALILREPCEYASAIVAERSGIPHAQIAVSLAEVEWSSLEIAAPALEPHGAGLVAALRTVPYLTRFPASLDPSPFPRTMRVREQASVGAGTLAPARSHRAEEPLVYATLGSVTGSLDGAATAHRALAEALAELPVQALLTTGRDVDPAVLGPLPSNVRAARWVPQADALAAASLVICHGGSGTVLATLAAGVPLVVVPLFADQPRNGRLVERAGAGLVVEGDRERGAANAFPPAARLRPAIERVLADPGHRAAAARIAAEMSASPSADDALARLSRAA